MGKYRVKTNDVEAEKFTGRNWNAIERWLGPHLTKSEERPGDPTDVAYFVFDVASKKWMLVHPGSYVVRDASGAIDVMKASAFEEKWEPVPPATRDMFPALPGSPLGGPPYRATFGDGSAVRP